MRVMTKRHLKPPNRLLRPPPAAAPYAGSLQKLQAQHTRIQSATPAFSFTQVCPVVVYTTRERWKMGKGRCH